MASTHSRILSFDMKGSGKEGRPTVRSVCGLLLQQPPHRRQPISSGSWGGWLALRASGTGPSRCHYCPRRWGSPDTTPWCYPEAGPKARVTMTPRPAAFARAGDCTWETLPEFSFVRSFVRAQVEEMAAAFWFICDERELTAFCRESQPQRRERRHLCGCPARQPTAWPLVWCLSAPLPALVHSLLVFLLENRSVSIFLYAFFYLLAAVFSVFLTF